MEQLERINRGERSLISDPNFESTHIGDQGQYRDQVFVDENGRTYKPVFFSYPLTFDIPAGSAFVGQSQIQIQADADFNITQMQYNFVVDGTPVTTPTTRPIPSALDVQLTDGGSNATLINAPVPVPTLFGDGLLPFILPQSKTLPASSTFQVNLNSNGITLDPANDSVLTLVFTGEKRYFYTQMG